MKKQQSKHDSHYIVIVEREILILQILTIGVSVPIVTDYLGLICTFLKTLQSHSTEFLNYRH